LIYAILKRIAIAKVQLHTSAIYAVVLEIAVNNFHAFWRSGGADYKRAHTAQL
jgi:hypothetical protein